MLLFDYSSLDQEIKKIIAKKQHCTLLLFEIVNLFQIIAIYDLVFINQLVINFNNLLKKIFGQNIKLHRNCNDYFLIVIEECDENKLNNLLEVLKQQLYLFGSDDQDYPFHLQVKTSSVIIPDDALDANDAFNKAFIAIKNLDISDNKNYAPYDDVTLNREFIKEFMLKANILKKAIIEKKFILAFQPIINSKTGVVDYHESLLRLIGEDGKVISIGPFIEIAEKLGIINLIDELVIDMVAVELQKSKDIILSFNISGIGIDNDHLLRKIKKTFDNPEIASRVIIELTETAAQKDLGKSALFVANLQELGCRVALDDFGSGHTSFRQLKALPVDIIKIDGIFIRDIISNADNRLFVKALLNISRGFGLKTVAEFVESGEIAKLLIDLKVDYLQGNFFRPAVNYRSWDIN